MDIQAHRSEPTGLHAGAPRTHVQPAEAAFSLVAEELVQAESILHVELAHTIPAVAEIGCYLASAGGKRMRPLLTALGARAAGHSGEIARLMTVGEMVHLGSLLHDDVVDEGAERRGKAAAHRVYGNPAVILTGDSCVSRGLLIAAEEAGIHAVTGLARTVSAMSEGEVTQLLNAGNLDVGLPTYLEIIDKKSASLIAWCAAAGAWAIDEPARAEALGAFGRCVGIAFQVTDDVLDYTGEKRFTGKRRGADLAQRKLTLPLLLALERVPTLRARLSAKAMSPERIPALIKEVTDCGATTDALAMARERVDEGLMALGTLPESPARDALASLAHHMIERVA
jgi:octaprenyl-diphosphate synthase